LQVYRWHINGVNVTNSEEEFLWASVTLTLAKLWNIQNIQVLGKIMEYSKDSSIGGFKGDNRLAQPKKQFK
jgi:hypothetical protein